MGVVPVVGVSGTVALAEVAPRRALGASSPLQLMDIAMT